MEQLNPIYSAIGRMEAQLARASEDRAEFRNLLRTVEERVEEIARDQATMKNRGWGLIVGVGLVAGSLSAGLGTLIEKALKVFH
jgi:hypothetical protein